MRPDVYHLVFDPMHNVYRYPYTGPWTDMKWREDLLNMVESVPMRKPHPKRKFEARVGHLDELEFAAVENPMRPKHDVDDIIMRCVHKRQTKIYEHARTNALMFAPPPTDRVPAGGHGFHSNG